jgi:hypothetical protein
MAFQAGGDSIKVPMRDDDETKAGFANYRGDIRREVAGQISGPTDDGFLMKAVVAEYDSQTDTTRVAFVAIN